MSPNKKSLLLFFLSDSAATLDNADAVTSKGEVAKQFLSEEGHRLHLRMNKPQTYHAGQNDYQQKYF